MINRHRLGGLGIGMLTILVMAVLGLTVNASASAPEDVQNAVADTLGITSYDAGLILAASVLFAILLPLSMTRMKAGPMCLVALIVLAPMTSLGFLDASIYIVAMILVAGMFALGVVKLT